MGLAFPTPGQSEQLSCHLFDKLGGWWPLQKGFCFSKGPENHSSSISTENFQHASQMSYKGENKWEHPLANWLDLPENLSGKMPYASVQGQCEKQPEMRGAVPLKTNCSSISCFWGTVTVLFILRTVMQQWNKILKENLSGLHHLNTANMKPIFLKTPQCFSVVFVCQASTCPSSGTSTSFSLWGVIPSLSQSCRIHLVSRVHTWPRPGHTGASILGPWGLFREGHRSNQACDIQSWGFCWKW